jgi:hypothetical protein
MNPSLINANCVLANVLRFDPQPPTTAVHQAASCSSTASDDRLDGH